MQLSDQLTVICLIRQDDSVGTKDRGTDGMKSLQNLAQAVKRNNGLGLDVFSLQESFFVLGRASEAMIFSVPNLTSVTRCIRTIDSLGSESRQATNPQLGIFEIDPFPCIMIDDKHDKQEGMVPCLFFIRSPKPLENLRAIIENSTFKTRVSNAFVGFGSYNIILLIRNDNLSALNQTIQDLRAKLEFTETRTIFGVPDESLRREEKKHAASEPFYNFSIMAKCVGSVDSNLEKEVLRVLKGDFHHMFYPLLKGEERIAFRQGYMDMEIPGRSQTVGEVFDATCRLRREVARIFDTATEIKAMYQPPKN